MLYMRTYLELISRWSRGLWDWETETMWFSRTWSSCRSRDTWTRADNFDLGLGPGNCSVGRTPSRRSNHRWPMTGYRGDGSYFQLPDCPHSYPRPRQRAPKTRHAYTAVSYGCLSNPSWSTPGPPHPTSAGPAASMHRHRTVRRTQLKPSRPYPTACCVANAFRTVEQGLENTCPAEFCSWLLHRHRRWSAPPNRNTGVVAVAVGWTKDVFQIGNGPAVRKTRPRLWLQPASEPTTADASDDRQLSPGTSSRWKVPSFTISL